MVARDGNSLLSHPNGGYRTLPVGNIYILVADTHFNPMLAIGTLTPFSFGAVSACAG